MRTRKPTRIGIWWARKCPVPLEILGQEGCVLSNLAEVYGLSTAS
jgi:hypothetical protein